MIRLVLKYCFALTLLMSIPVVVEAQQASDSALKEQVAKEMAPDSVAVDEDLQMDAVADSVAADEDLLAEEEESKGVYQTLKTKFIEGNAGFMSLVALALVLGLAFCIERIIYLTMSEINTKRFMGEVDKLIDSGDIEGAKELCRNTRGPVASVCYQGLVRIDEPTEEVERSVANYGSVMVANMEKGCSWITLFIAMAPSLGFLGTVIGMVMAFDQIQSAGDISPTIVAAGMKVALITTIFGIIVALILQLFYNYILTKIEHLTVEMEDAAITLMDSIVKYHDRNEAK
jgi:biopolymer transport protein ExbB